MASSYITQNLVPSEPQLIDLLNLLKKDIYLNFNAHHIGTIQAFDIDNQTASVTINYKKTFFEFNPETNAYISNLVNYPVLSEVPVICLGGGPGALTFPIAEGDECLVLFNDRDLDNWFSSGSGSGTATARLHSFSDAIALVGLRSTGNVLQNYDPQRSVLRGNAGVVAVNTGSSKILVANVTPTVNPDNGDLSYSTTLNTLIAQLISNVKDLVTAVNAITVTTIITVPTTPFGPTPVTSGTPNNSSQINNVTSELMTTANQIAALLE